MIALDTSAIIAILKGEDDALRLMNRWLDAESTVIGAPTLLECHLVIQHKESKITEPELLALLQRMRTEIVAFDEHLLAISVEAHRRYGRGKHKAKLNFGDCMSYALAKFHDVPLLCKGEDFRHTDVTLAG